MYICCAYDLQMNVAALTIVLRLYVYRHLDFFWTGTHPDKQILDGNQVALSNIVEAQLPELRNSLS